jgi:hypothetical protein
MPGLEDYRCFIDALESSGLPYCVTGSVASGIYGEPRFTADIDFVLLLKAKDIALLRRVFPEEEYYIPPIEVLAVEAARTHRGMFNLIQHRQMVKADVFLGSADRCTFGRSNIAAGRLTQAASFGWPRRNMWSYGSSNRFVQSPRTNISAT